MPRYTMQHTPIADITFTRKREPNEEADYGLREGIRQQGVLQPIILVGAQAPFALVAGERRLISATEVGLTEIPSCLFPQLSPIDVETIALETNTKRLDLPWREQVAATAHIHKHFCASSENWSQADTANILGWTQPYISVLLQLSERSHELCFAGCTNLKEARQVLDAIKLELKRDVITNLMKPSEHVNEYYRRPKSVVLASTAHLKAPTLKEALELIAEMTELFIQIHDHTNQEYIRALAQEGRIAGEKILKNRVSAQALSTATIEELISKEITQ